MRHILTHPTELAKTPELQPIGAPAWQVPWDS